MHRIRTVIALLIVVSVPTLVQSASLERGHNEQQQPDPKKNELTASVTRSTENEVLTLHAYFPEDAQNIRIALYNILGKLIDLDPTTTVSKGAQTFYFQTRGLPNGPYIILVEASGQRVVNKVMVSR